MRTFKNPLHWLRNQRGFMLTSEMVLISTISVIGMTVGLVTMRDAVTAEAEDVSEAIGALDQSYQFNGLVNPQLSASVDGSQFGDAVDTNAGDGVAFSFVQADNAEGSLVTASDGSSSAANTGGPTVGLANP